MIIIETKRLILRTWKEEDAPILFHLHQHPKVTEFTGAPFTMEQVNDFMIKANKCQEQDGYTAWALELKETKELIGFISLFWPEWEAHFTPAAAIGWCLGFPYWGNGYATEGSRAVLDYGFDQCGFEEIFSFTVPMNSASLRVMEKIGMEHDPYGDFAHPELPLDHRLSKHVLYRTKNPLISPA